MKLRNRHTGEVATGKTFRPVLVGASVGLRIRGINKNNGEEYTIDYYYRDLTSLLNDWEDAE